MVMPLYIFVVKEKSPLIPLLSLPSNTRHICGHWDLSSMNLWSQLTVASLPPLPTFLRYVYGNAIRYICGHWILKFYEPVSLEPVVTLGFVAPVAHLFEICMCGDWVSHL